MARGKRQTKRVGNRTTRKAKPSSGKRAGKRKRSKVPRSPPLTAKRIRKVKEAVDVTRPKGPRVIRVGESRETTIKNFSQLHKTLSSIRKIDPEGRYSYQLQLSYVDTSGKRKTFTTPERSALPVAKTIKRRIHTKKLGRFFKASKRGKRETTNEAFIRSADSRVRGFLFRELERVYGQYPSVKAGKIRSKSKLLNMRRRRAVKYKVIINREIT